MAFAAAGDTGDRAVLGDPDVRRLPAGLCADRRRSGQCHPAVRHLCLSTRHRHRIVEPGCIDLTGDFPDPAARGDPATSLHPADGDALAMIEGARWRRWVFFYVPVTGFVVALLFPFYWMVVTTVKPDKELYRPWSAPNYAPFWTLHPTLEHVTDLLTTTLFSTWMLNTRIISLSATLISLFCGLLAGYALARLKFPFAGGIGTGIFITYLVPQTLLFIPLSDIIRNFHLGDSPWALILTYPTFLIPFCTWLMMGYFKAIPRELEE